MGHLVHLCIAFTVSPISILVTPATECNIFLQVAVNNMATVEKVYHKLWHLHIGTTILNTPISPVFTPFVLLNICHRITLSYKPFVFKFNTVEG